MGANYAKPDYVKAKQIAEKTLNDNCLSELPINTKELAENSGLSVISVKFGQISPEYSEISGFIDSTSKMMYVNADDTPERQNFTIAHELGHFLLGHVDKSEYEVLYRRPLADRQNKPMEQEANCFAANLLVPQKMLEDLKKKYSFITNSQLATIFGVSNSVIGYRLNHCNLGG